MSFTFSTNNTPTAGTIAIYTVLTTLVSAGWTVKADSDGTTYASSGGQITGGNSGAHGLANTQAWFRIQAPIVGSQHRELVFQRTTTNLLWRIKYSASAGFTGGSPGATRVPSATDEVVIFGSGTDASPTGATLFGTDGAYRFSVCAGDSSIGYGFYWYGNTSTTTTLTTGFLMDVMLAGTYSSGDTDPCVIYCPTSATNIFASTITAYTNTFGLLGTSYTGISTSIIQFSSSFATANVIFPAGAGGHTLPNPFTSNDDMFPVYWGKCAPQAAPNGLKGTSSVMLAPSTQRTNLDTFTISSSKDHILLGWYVFPWDGSVPTI